MEGGERGDVVVVGVGAHGLLLLPVDVHQRHARLHATEGLEEKADFLATVYEDERLRAQVRLQEGEEQLQLLPQLAHHVSLRLRRERGKNARSSSASRSLPPPSRSRTAGPGGSSTPTTLGEGRRRHLLHVVVHGGAEEEILAIGSQRVHDVLQTLPESHVQTAVHLVDHQALHVRAVERGSLLDVLQQTARSRHQDVHRHDPLLLVLK